MRLTFVLPGLLMFAVGCPVPSARAHEWPLPLRHRFRSECGLLQAPQPAPNPILNVLAQRLRAAFRRDHLPINVSFDDGALVGEYHTHHEKLYLTGMDGKESSRVSDLTIPAADGVRLEFQVEAGNYVTQQVRPQTLHLNYRTSSKGRVKWTTYLDHYALKKADRSLLLNFAFGDRVRPHWVTAIKTAVRNCVTETMQSASATERQLFAGLK